jgi:YesN/AraC family two-component response regulator
MQHQVLLIEDDKQTLDLFLDCLKAEGFDAIGAHDGAHGLALAQQHLPSLIVCDIIMPERDGYEVLSELRQNPPTATIPLVFFTAKQTQAEVRQGMLLGADDYLTKPSSVKDFLSTVSAQIGKREQLQRHYAAQFEENPDLAQEVKDSEDNTSIFPNNAGPMQALFDFIEANYHRPITLSEVAQSVGYSPAYLTSQVGNLTGRTVNRWIIERRMAAARDLLLQGDRTIEDIATTIGYQHTCHFSRQFRKYHGKAPNTWRTEKRQQLAATSA